MPIRCTGPLPAVAMSHTPTRANTRRPRVVLAVATERPDRPQNARHLHPRRLAVQPWARPSARTLGEQPPRANQTGFPPGAQGQCFKKNNSSKHARPPSRRVKDTSSANTRLSTHWSTRPGTRVHRTTVWSCPVSSWTVAATTVLPLAFGSSAAWRANGSGAGMNQGHGGAGQDHSPRGAAGVGAGSGVGAESLRRASKRRPFAPTRRKKCGQGLCTVHALSTVDTALNSAAHRTCERESSAVTSASSSSSGLNGTGVALLSLP